jgi:hypothetical protein
MAFCPVTEPGTSNQSILDVMSMDRMGSPPGGISSLNGLNSKSMGFKRLGRQLRRPGEAWRQCHEACVGLCYESRKAYGPADGAWQLVFVQTSEHGG